MSDLEEFFREQIKPYEERLKKLEDLDKKKDVEISLLKAAIEHMKTTIDNLRAQLEKNKPVTARPGTAAVKKDIKPVKK
jgi:predicted RNase H-like nuclease (RuvC/YqgF family)